MIDLRRLEALVALHRTGSVSAAAASLHYGQPTISHHLRRLEAETGAVLLQRVGRGVRLGQGLGQLGTGALDLIDERCDAAHDGHTLSLMPLVVIRMRSGAGTAGFHPWRGARGALRRYCAFCRFLLKRSMRPPVSTIFCLPV